MVDAAVRFSDESADDFARQKVDIMLAATARLLGDPARLSMLDVGCGVGLAERFLVSRVGCVVAGDVSGPMVEEARRFVPGVEFTHLPPHGLPYDEQVFDVQFCYCVYHHVPVHERPAMVAELVRVVRPGGLLFVFEHNPYNPVTRRIVAGCRFDRDAVLLTPRETRELLAGAGLDVVDQRYYVFFPKILGFLRRIEPWLGWLPLGGQYYVVARKPR